MSSVESNRRRAARYYKRHKKKILARLRKVYANNPELHKQAHKERYALNRMKDQERQRRNRLWVLFRLTPEDWDKINVFQKGVCPITGKPPGTNKLGTDHDHKTGMIRGLLNPLINRALALFEDNPKWLRAAADYLENPPATQALGKQTFGLVGRAKYKRKMIYGSPDGPLPPVKKAKKVKK